jgi:hypothetical protein
VELGADFRQAARLVAAADLRDQEGAPERILVASIMAGSGNDDELRTGRRSPALPGRRRGRASS